jgi:hypothetical protein
MRIQIADRERILCSFQPVFVIRIEYLPRNSETNQWEERQVLYVGPAIFHIRIEQVRIHMEQLYGHSK